MDLTTLTLLVAGIAIILAPFLPGGPQVEPHAVRILLGFVCVYLAVLIRERRKMSRQFRELLAAFDGFNAAIYGPDHKTRRKSVDYLIEALHTQNVPVREKAANQLRRITGLDLGVEPGPWSAWWGKHRDTFVFPDAPRDASAGGARIPAPGPEK